VLKRRIANCELQAKPFIIIHGFSMHTYSQQLTSMVLLLLLSHAVIASPEIPGDDPAGPVALVGATVYLVKGKTIKDSTVVWSKGRIVAVGRDVEIPEGAKQIKISGKHVYPSLISANSSLGLIEINAVRATLDIVETGRINPNTRAQVAINPDSELIPVARSNGVLLSLSMPRGGLISGTSALIQHDGWTWEDMTLRSPVGMHVQWPQMAPVLHWHTEKTGKEQLEERDKTLQQLQQTFDDARAYAKARNTPKESLPVPQPIDLRWEAMHPVLDGKLPLIVRADRADQIQAAVAFASRENVRLIILGGQDAEVCVRLLKKHKVPVIIAGTLRLPHNRDDAYDAAYTLPERLRRAGVKYCIGMGGRFSDSNMRNLPYNAAMSVGFGLSQHEALRAITLYPAEILDVSDRVGSLTVGKDATLFVTDGDILETSTQVEMAFIQGRQVDLSNRHKRLWNKYQEKYRRLGEGP
jgi:imidazolonepropionase-like amidohydrolase